MRKLTAVLFGVVAGIAVNSAIAQVTTKVLDQANQASFFNNGFSFFTREGNSIRWAGQTITAGITGQLTQVDLPIWRQPDFDSGIHLQILNSSLSVLGSVTVPSSSIRTGDGAFPPPGADPFSVSIDLSGLGINVVAGQSFVIAARSTALFPAGIGGNGMNWLGLGGDPYGGGHQFVQFATTITDTSFGSAGADLGFRTYVLANPIDTTPPVLNLPASFAVDATNPAGATVNYTVTATDDSGVAPSVSCFPLSGVTFTIGMTTVNCTATDTAGNSATGSFTVTVNGPVAQLSNLILLVGSFDNSFGMTNSLGTKLQNAIDALKESNATNACNSLNAFINEAQAQSGKKLTAGQANLLIERANQIRAVQDCR
jgi:hypothetical protein